jgi:hypothetical protein
MPGLQRVMKEMMMLEDLLLSALEPQTLGRCTHHHLQDLLVICKEYAVSPLKLKDTSIRNPET